MLETSISLNAMQRGKIAGTALPQEDYEVETVDDTLTRFTKELQSIDGEIMEFCFTARDSRPMITGRYLIATHDQYMSHCVNSEAYLH